LRILNLWLMKIELLRTPDLQWQLC